MSITDAFELLVRFQGQLVQRVSLTGDVLTIGRTPDNGLSLPHPLIARRHAELRLEGEGLTLIDLGGSGGTFLGDARLLPNQPQLLRDGTTFRIGPFELVYRSVGAAEGAPPEPVEQLPNGAVAAPPGPRPAAVPRPTFPPPRPRGPLGRYLHDLPVIYHDSDFLGRFLLIIEALWEPLEQRQDHIALYFDPRCCPAAMLPYLASWLDMPLDRHWPEGRQRALLAEAVELTRWRGTRYGLARVIELATGLTPEILDEPDQPFVMRVRVALPDDDSVDRQFVEALIQTHKPAHVGFILELR